MEASGFCQKITVGGTSMSLVTFKNLYDVQNVAMAFSHYNYDYWTSGVCKPRPGRSDTNTETSAPEHFFTFGEERVDPSMLCQTTNTPDCSVYAYYLKANLTCLDHTPSTAYPLCQLAGPTSRRG